MKGLVCATLVVVLSSLTNASSQKHEASAAGPARLTVFVEHNGSDSMGARLAFQVREMIRSSQGYTLADSQESTGSTIVLVTNGDAPCSISVDRSAFYWTLKTNKGAFATTSAISFVAEGSIKRSAENVLAAVDRFFVETKSAR